MSEEKRISDMYLAAALLSSGVTFLGVDRVDKSRQKFIFKGVVPNVVIAKDDISLEKLSNISIDEYEMHFLARRIWYEPSYPDSIRTIKSAIHSG